jgi:hypothetical protein
VRTGIARVVEHSSFARAVKLTRFDDAVAIGFDFISFAAISKSVP